MKLIQAVLLGVIGFLLALLLPTPIFLVIAGGWLARWGWQRRKNTPTAGTRALPQPSPDVSNPEARSN